MSDLDETGSLQQSETHLRSAQHFVPLLMAYEHWPSYVTGSAQKADRVYLADLPVFIFSTFLTIFCSSIKNARMILSLTTLWSKQPPYTLCTVLFFFDKCLLLSLLGLMFFRPLSLTPVAPHLAADTGFF